MIRRILKRWAWKLVREEVGAAILAAEQRQLELHRSATEAVNSAGAMALAIHDESVLRDQALHADTVALMHATLGKPGDLADSGLEFVPPGKLN